MDRLHDAVQLGIHLALAPTQAHGVLRHLQAAHRHPAGVRRLARRVEDAGLEEQVDGFQGRGHVGAFGDTDATVGQQAPHPRHPVRSGSRRAARYRRPGPQGRLLRETAGKLLRHSRMRPRRTFFSSIRYSHCSSESPPRHTGCLRNRTARSPAAHFHDLARRVLGDVARAGDRHPLAVEAAATILSISWAK